MTSFMAIALGGALGAMGRFASSQWLYGLIGRSFPYGTLFVNFIGSFLAGLLAVMLLERMAASPEIRAFLFIGFLGSFTTFSTFSLETVNLFISGDTLKAFVNMLVNVFVCVMACWLGLLLGRQL